jgi:hypothetical protein
MDIMSQVEAEGWALTYANHVNVQTGEDSRNRWMESGQRVAIRGKLVGIYLFRRDEAEHTTG